MNKQTIKDIKELRGKRVLLRCDFNVPINKQTGEITDNGRILESLATIRYLKESGAKVILCSHLGKPKGGVDSEFSLAPVAKELSMIFEEEVKLAKDVVGEDAFLLASKMQEGDVILLENTRFEPGETKNDLELSKKLASLADYYIDDAFGAVHRAHSSIAGVADYIPAYIGFLIEKELNILGNALENPKRPFVSILGGAKVSEKIEVIESLLEKADTLIIGGGMANTFFSAMGYGVGASLCEEDKINVAQKIMESASEKGVKLLLPVDVKIGKGIDDTQSQIIEWSEETNKIPDDMGIFDIGPKTVKLYSEELKRTGRIGAKEEEAKTVMWNGPLGVFEKKQWAEGTMEIAEAVSRLGQGVTTIVGGGETASAVKKAEVTEKITHISTGGGATLEFIVGFIKGEILPGIKAIPDRDIKKNIDIDDERGS